MAVYKRARASAAPETIAPMAPALPAAIVEPATSADAIATAKASLDRAERSFSDEAQKIGIGPAFVTFGSADAINLGRPDDRMVVLGSEAIGRMVGEGYGAGQSPVNWAPERVIVASSGDLGVTIGWIKPNTPAADRPAKNPFFTIWRRASATHPWRYIAE